MPAVRGASSVSSRAAALGAKRRSLTTAEQRGPGRRCVAESRGHAPTVKYNKDQWISSFEDEMVKLRPHMAARVLVSIGLMAWHKHGTKDEDPKKAARDWSKAMDAKK